MVAAAALQVNTRYAGRYATRARTSHQGTARREFTVLEAAHTLPNYLHGEVIRVLDHGDNQEKRWYTARLFEVDGIDDDDTPAADTLAPGTAVRINRRDSRDGSILGRIVSDDGILCQVRSFLGTMQLIAKARLRPLTDRQLLQVTRRHSRRSRGQPPQLS
jgi:hypothetical protein